MTNTRSNNRYNAVNAQLPAARIAAIEQLNAGFDHDVLKRVATGDLSSGIRRLAIEKLTPKEDREEFERMACRDTLEANRRFAIGMLDPHCSAAALESIALGQSDYTEPDERSLALSRLDNRVSRTALYSLAGGFVEVNPQLRVLAFEKLGLMEDDSIIPKMAEEAGSLFERETALRVLNQNTKIGKAVYERVAANEMVTWPLRQIAISGLDAQKSRPVLEQIASGTIFGFLRRQAEKKLQ